MRLNIGRSGRGISIGKEFVEGINIVSDKIPFPDLSAAEIDCEYDIEEATRVLKRGGKLTCPVKYYQQIVASDDFHKYTFRDNRLVAYKKDFKLSVEDWDL